MKYAVLDDSRKIINIIEVEQEFASQVNGHYLGNATLGIGDQYPDSDFRCGEDSAESQRKIQELTAKIDYITMMANIDMEGLS